MDAITNFFENITAGNNYIWIIGGALVIIVALVGFFADKANKRKRVEGVDNNESVTPVVEQPITEEINNPVLETEINSTFPISEESVNDELYNGTIGEPMVELGRATETLSEEPINMTPMEPMIETVPMGEPINITPMEPMVETAPLEESINVTPMEPMIETAPLGGPINITPMESMVETAPVGEPINITPMEPMVETAPMGEPINITPMEPMIEMVPMEEPINITSVDEISPININPLMDQPVVEESRINENEFTDIPRIDSAIEEKPEEDIEIISE